MSNIKTLDACLGNEIQDMIKNHGPIIAASIRLMWSNRNFHYDDRFDGPIKYNLHKEVETISRLTSNLTILNDLNRKEDELLCLLQGYSQDDFDAFMKRANEYHYDSGFGLEDIDGIVYCENGTYYIRQYDGSTTWNLIPLPPKTIEEARDVIM